MRKVSQILERKGDRVVSVAADAPVIKIAQDAFEQAFGIRPILTRSGGTLPTRSNVVSSRVSKVRRSRLFTPTRSVPTLSARAASARRWSSARQPSSRSASEGSAQTAATSPSRTSPIARVRSTISSRTTRPSSRAAATNTRSPSIAFERSPSTAL